MVNVRLLSKLSQDKVSILLVSLVGSWLIMQMKFVSFKQILLRSLEKASVKTKYKMQFLYKNLHDNFFYSCRTHGRDLLQ